MADGAMGGRQPKTRSIVAFAVIVMLTITACGASASRPSAGLAGQLRAVPAPRSASIMIGPDAPGVDGGVPFIGFVSTEAPAVAAQAYDQRLAGAGFAKVGPRDGWIRYMGNGLVLSVAISEDGPPTSIIVRVTPADAAVSGSPPAVGSTAGATGAPDSHRPTTAPGTAGPSSSPRVASTAGPSSSPTVASTVGPSTPEPASRPGGKPSKTPPGKGGTPPGQGGTPPGQGGTPPGKGERPTPAPTTTAIPGHENANAHGKP